MMGSSDAVIWHIEEDPQLRSTIVAVWELDAVPEPGRMHESLQRMVAAIPRLRQRVVPGRPRPSWVDVDDLDLTRHFLERRLEGKADVTAVHRFAEEWVCEGFDRKQPQWGLALLTGLAGSRAAIVIKVHHAIADGIGLVLMLAAFTDLEPNPERRPEPNNVVELPLERPVFSRPRRLVSKVRRSMSELIAEPLQSAVRVCRTLRSALRLVWPSRTPLSPVMTQRSGDLALLTRSVPLADFKRAGREAGGTLNDTFVAVVIDALDRYHVAVGDVPRRLGRVRVHMPVDVRAGRTATVAGNQFVPARVVLDVPHGRPSHRVTSIGRQLSALQHEPALGHINTVAAAVLRLGKRPTRWILGGMMKGVDVLASNVPGPNFPLYVAGVKVERFHAFGPPAGAALNVTLFSYDGQVNLGISCDTAAVTNRHLLLDCLDEALDALMLRERSWAMNARSLTQAM
jgi:diacylglycerol O-acyltransferase / wax synthase